MKDICFLAICCLLFGKSFPFYYFSTHTPYDFVRGDITNVTWDEDLEPIKIYVLARHGSRHLGNSSVTGMDLFLNDLLASSEAIDRFPWLETWERPTYLKDYELVPQGMLQHFMLAKRYKARFPGLFPLYYPSNYSIRATNKLRTSQSAASFMFGLFENEGPLEDSATRTNFTNTGFQPTAVQIESENEDILLRFMDNCPAYENSEVTLTAGDYADSIIRSVDYKQIVLDPISQIVGFPVDAYGAEGLYDLCTFEEVSPTESRFSSFCEMIPLPALELLDFQNDLKRYYKSSYPNKLGYEISCVILEDLVDQFLVDPPVATFRFAHSETIVPVITLLGLFKDDADPTLISTDYKKRLFRLSEIDPFATSLVFVLFKNIKLDEEYVKVYLNEKEVKIPSCESPDGCLISELQDIIARTEGSCDIAKMCFKWLDPEKKSQEEFVLTSDLEKELVKNRLQQEDAVLLNLYVFIAMVVLSALSVVTCGFICLNRAKLFPNEESYKSQPMLSYQKMPFLD